MSPSPEEVVALRSLVVLLPSNTGTRLGVAVVIALLAIALARRARVATVDLLRRRTAVDPAILLLVGRLSYFAVLVIAGLWILNIFGTQPTALLTLLGAVGLAISLALQDVLRNLFAGLYLLLERPFTIGDIIEVRGVRGTVESVELRLTVLSTIDGLRATVPNATVFTEILVNRSARPSHRWPLYVTLPRSVTDLSPLRSAVEQAARRLADGAPAPTLAVQASTRKGTLVQVGLWVPDPSALGDGILALHAALPEATIAVPDAPALPDPPPAPPRRKRVSRSRPTLRDRG